MQQNTFFFIMEIVDPVFYVFLIGMALEMIGSIFSQRKHQTLTEKGPPIPPSWGDAPEKWTPREQNSNESLGRTYQAYTSSRGREKTQHMYLLTGF